MYVDSYCERVAPGLWGEPANAASNVAFLLASALLFSVLARQPRRVPASLWLLPALLATVGLCSLAFHTFATRLTETFDTLSIVAFILVAVTALVRWMWGLRWRLAWLAAPAYLGFALGLNAAIEAIGGESATVGGYLPAFAGLVALGAAIRFTAPGDAARFGHWLLVAAAVFAVSLSLRTLDGPACRAFPLGTHFIWHVLNAVVLFVVGYAVFRRWQQLPAPGSSTVR